jgi:hypothetical protein
MLRQAPILINCGGGSRQLCLTELRQAERGVGDHALTMFDTGETMVFDQSHIFFDGAWGAALAEIMTQEALVWAGYLSSLPAPSVVNDPHRPQALSFNVELPNLEIVQQARRVVAEAGAETDRVDLKAMLKLRHHFKQRNDRIQLTVNDLLILYRAIHVATYQPSSELVSTLKSLTGVEPTRDAASGVLEGFEAARQTNSAILIPVDASQRTPGARLHPITLEVPLHDLDLLNLHQRVVAAWQTYTQTVADRDTAYEAFDQLRRDYLARLAGLGALLNRAKEIAGRGESFTVGALKLLAHMPPPIQRMLEQIPQNFDMLNDIIRGRESFSNIGAVAPTSTLTRFLSANDDNCKKTLIWGVLTDADGVMRLTLRDFRPHVPVLVACGHMALAQRLAHHYLETYAQGLNNFVYDLDRITRARPALPETNHG